MKMLLQLWLVALMALVSCAPLKDGTPSVAVQLSSAGGTAIYGSVTNDGDVVIKLLIPGSILDDRHVKKVNVLDGMEELPFKGVIADPSPNITWSAEHIATLTPGEHVLFFFDIANDYTFYHANETLSAFADSYFLNLGHDTLAAHLEYQSNVIEIYRGDEEPGHSASTRSLPVTGADISYNCSAHQNRAIKSALTHCFNITTAAVYDAAYVGDKFKSFFGTNNLTLARNVTARKLEIREECARNHDSITHITCEDIERRCDDNTTIYPIDGQVLVLCEDIWNYPVISQTCGSEDMAGTIVRGMTLLDKVFRPATEDCKFGENATHLAPSVALSNADTYRMYAQAVYLNCTWSDGSK